MLIDKITERGLCLKANQDDSNIWVTNRVVAIALEDDICGEQQIPTGTQC